MPDRAKKLLSKVTTKIDTLWPIKDAISAINLGEHNVATLPLLAHEVEPNGYWQDDVVVIGVVSKVLSRSENEPSRIQDRLDRGQSGRVTGEDRFVEIRLNSDLGALYA